MSSRKTGLWIRMAVVSLLMMVLYIGFALVLGSYFGYFWGFATVAVVVSAVQLWFGHKISLKMMGGKVVSEKEYPELHRTVERMANKAGIPKPQVGVSSMSVPNAFAAGRSKDTAVVCVTEELVRTLDEDELEAVIAHEITHIDNRDMVIMTVASTLGTIAFYFARFGWHGDSKNGNILVAVAAALVVWVLSFFLTRALSRYREFAADRGAAELTGNPEALISALNSINNRMKSPSVKKEDVDTASGASAMMISPIEGKKLTELFKTHPSLERREKALRELNQ